jgi:predicted nucleotidyltransferase component of viral defense system
VHDRPYPTSLTELAAWCKRYGTTTDEARKRFVQFVILNSIGNVPSLREQLVFKGGNALRFLYGNRRTTIDLDFSAIGAFVDDPDHIRSLLDHAFRIGGYMSGIKIRCQSIRRNPPGSDKNFPTYEIKAGYQFSEDRYFAGFEQQQRPVSTVVDLDISFNDPVCESHIAQLAPNSSQVRACALEDILAEKLRALLQQRLRKRHRRQDVYDIAQMVRHEAAHLDRHKIARYFQLKCEARSIDPRRSAFDCEIKNLAAYDYETLFSRTDPEFIPFKEAWKTVLDLVRELNISQ